MEEQQANLKRRYLYSIYQRIKKSKDAEGMPLCCVEWRLNPQSFYAWYERRLAEQKGICEYCHLIGDTTKSYGRPFRKGRRGLHLEVDRKSCNGQYSPDNCVLACYPCNNAKSDVFSYEEFLEIGETIGKVKLRSNFAQFSD
jgi:hypothetical protein